MINLLKAFTLPRDVAVSCLIPFNFIIRFLRVIWLSLKAPSDIMSLEEKHKILTDLGFTESKEGFLKKTNSGYIKVPKHLLNKDYTKQQFNDQIAKLTRYINKFHGDTRD
jgi:hypothetical protein